MTTFAIAMASMLALACSQSPDYILASEVRIIDGEAAAHILSVEDEGNIVFVRGEKVFEDLSEGNLIAIGANDKTPFGFLRKVETISRSSDQVTLTTSAATILDAVKKGRIEQQQVLSLGDAHSVEMLDERVTILQRASAAEEPQPGDGFVVGFDELVVYDDNGAQVVINGNLAVDPRFNLVLDIDGFSISQASFGFETTEGISFQIDSTADVVLSEEVPLMRIVFAVITLTIGPLPVVITPTLTLSLGAEGRVHAGLKTSITQAASLEFGFGYIDGEWQSYDDSSSTFDFDVPSPAAAASARVFAGPKLAIMLYGVVGPFAEAEGYLEMAAEVEGTPPCLSWQLAAGIDANVGMEFIADYQTTVVAVRSVLSEYDCLSGEPPPGIAASWSKSFGGPSAERATAVTQTPDGGYLMAAQTQSFFAPFLSTWLVKTSPNGEVQWQKAYRGMELPSMVTVTPDGSYVVVGGVAGTSLDSARVTKLDGSGNVVWAKAYKGTGGTDLVAYAVRPLSDGTMVVVGRAGLGSPDAWVAKLASNGDLIWSKVYGGAGSDNAYSVDLTSGGGFIVAGDSNLSFADSSASYDYWVLRLDASGDVLWQNLYGGDSAVIGQNDGFEQAYGVVQTGADQFAVTGLSSSFGTFDAWTLKLDSSGNILWTTNLDGGGTVDRPHSITDTSDGGFVVVGRGGLLTNESALWGFELAGDGGVSWSKTYDGALADTAGSDSNSYQGIGQAVSVTSDGGLIACGTTQSFGADIDDDDQDAWLLKLTGTGEVDFDAASGAVLGNLAGTFSTPANVKTVATNAVATDLATTVTDTTSTIMVMITDAVTTSQSP